MSSSTNRAVRSVLPPAEMIAHFDGYRPTCRKCRAFLTVYDMQIHLETEPADPRFPKDGDGPELRYNRVDLSMRCNKCDEPSELIIMPADEEGKLDYYHDNPTDEEKRGWRRE